MRSHRYERILLSLLEDNAECLGKYFEPEEAEHVIQDLILYYDKPASDLELIIETKKRPQKLRP